VPPEQDLVVAALVYGTGVANDWYTCAFAVEE
jgi:hypothetical protein